METVLVVTAVPAHTLLYETVLSRHFQVRFSAKSAGGTGGVDAIVYDLASGATSIDFRWLEELDLPVVVLTPGDTLRLPPGPQRRVLTYPVSGTSLLQALAELGLHTGGRHCRGCAARSRGAHGHPCQR